MELNNCHAVSEANVPTSCTNEVRDTCCVKEIWRFCHNTKDVKKTPAKMISIFVVNNCMASEFES